MTRFLPAALAFAAAAGVVAAQDAAKTLADAQAAVQKGQYKQALKLLDPHLAANPTDAKAYTLRGRANGGAKKVEAALADFAKAVELAPKNGAAYYYRGRLLARQGKPDAALADFDKVVELSPKQAAGFAARGQILMEPGRAKPPDYDAAMNDFHKALALNEKLPDAHLGRALARLGRAAQTVTFRRGDQTFTALQYTPHAAFHALPDLGRELALNPKSAKALATRAECQQTLRDHAAEAADRKALTEIDKADGANLNRLAWLLAGSTNDKVRDGKAAVEAATRAVELAKDDPYRLDTLAAAHAAAGDFKKAVATQEQVIAGLKAPPGSPFHARLALYQKGQTYRDADDPLPPGASPPKGPRDKD